MRPPELPSDMVASAIRQRILSGDLKPGDQVPSVADLAAEFHVARATAAKGLRKLAQEGLVRQVRSWGTFVADRGPWTVEIQDDS